MRWASIPIKYSATDPSGNSATNTRTVYIVDTTAPAILSCITELVLPATTNCLGVLPDLTSSSYIVAADNCSSVTVAQLPPVGTGFPVASTNVVILTASDSTGNATNRAVAVVVPAAPGITLQPTNITVVVSNNATFSVIACGAGQLHYQWQLAGANLANATNSILTLVSVGTNGAGGYAVVVTNTSGSVTSLVATLAVIPFAPIPDPNLSAAIVSALGKPTCALTTADLLTLTNLCVHNANITNLSGLSWAANLTTLYLGGNAISDLTPLQNLSQLTTLFLYNNLITDLSPLAGLTNLNYLDVRWNPATNYEAVLTTLTSLSNLYLGGDSIANVAFLTNLSRLTFLDLDQNAILDPSPLAALTNLVGLDLSYNPLTNLSATTVFTNLNSLYLSGNSISNLLFLTSLARLNSLILCSNSVTDLSPLAGLPNLTALNLAQNPAFTIYGELASMGNLTNLWLYNNSISNLASVQTLTRLAYLNADGNAVSDLSPLSGLTALSALSLEGNLATNCSVLGGLTNLAHLRLGHNFINNLVFLTNLAHLTGAELYGNRIADLSPLVTLTNLNYLNLSSNQLANGTALSGLTNLVDLRLASETALSDLTFLAPLTRLTWLDLDNNQVSNLSPLAGLASLSFLNLSTNQVSNLSPLVGLTNLSSLYLQQNRLADITPLPSLQALSYVDVRLNLLDLSPASPARLVIQALTSRCPVVTVYPDQPDTAPSQRTPPTLTVLTAVAQGGWPIPANATSYLSFSVSDTGPAGETLAIGASSANSALLPSAGLIPGPDTNGNWTLPVRATASQPNATTITLTATNDVGLSTNVTVPVTVITPQPVVFPDPNLGAAVASTLGKSVGNLTTLDLLSLPFLVANSSQITNLSGLEWATNLANLYVRQNLLTDIRALTNLPWLLFADLSLNLLDLTSNSPAMTAVQGLINRGATVVYVPQRTPPVITAPASWVVGENVTSHLFFTVADSVASSAQLSVGARSSNTSLLPNANLVPAQYVFVPWWTVAATPSAGQTGTTTLTLTATNDAGLVGSWPVLVTVNPPVPLGGGPLSNWTNLTWLTFGNAPWYVQTNVTHNGLPAARSGAIGDGQESMLETTLVGPGTLNYWEKVSSEAGYDFLEFYINGQPLTNLFISGEVDWQPQTVSIPAGNQTIRWDYAKDNSNSAGQDAGWLSEVTFLFTGLWLEPAGPPVNGQFHFVLHGVPGNAYNILASSNMLNWQTQAIVSIPTTNTAGTVPYTDSPPANSPLRFYRAQQQF